MEIKISEITERIEIRAIKPQGIERLKRKISEVGYLPEKPILIAPNGTGYTLVDGGHRVAALEALGYETVVALLDESLTTRELQLRRARLANEVAETVVPTTFVDDAELVWRLSDEGMTQAEIGNILGWGRGKVSQFALLTKIDKEVWFLIATTCNQLVANDEDGAGSKIATDGSNFTERLLRPILSLTSEQQLALVTKLINDKDFSKSKFNARAEAYKIRNAIKDYVTAQLPGVSPDFIDARNGGVDKGSFDSDWKADDKPKITKLIESIKAEWERKSGTKLILGDFNKEVLTIDPGMVDLILTDPPYNISDSSKVTKRGSKIVDATFDDEEDWDSQTREDYLESLAEWAVHWERITRPGGSIISFCDKILVSDLWRALSDAGLMPKGLIIWEKDNPAPAGLGRRNLISSVEFMVWAVKPGASYTFNESEGWKRTNIINAPICGGDERLKDENGETLHPTQKPLKLLNPLIEVFSNRGDLVFDGFAGVGSMGEAATNQGRKFIGIEIQQKFYEAMSARLIDKNEH